MTAAGGAEAEPAAHPGPRPGPDAGPDPDALLLRTVAAGDPQAFAAFYDRWAPRLFRYCSAHMGDREAAADTCQEVLIAAWRGAAGFAGRGSVAAWLFGIAHRRVADALRSAARRAGPAGPGDARWELDPAEHDPGAAGGHDIQAGGGADPVDPRDAMREAEVRLDVGAGLAQLPAAHREVLVLAYAFGLSCAEIAAATGVPEGTVKSRLHHARRGLAREVEGA